MTESLSSYFKRLEDKGTEEAEFKKGVAQLHETAADTLTKRGVLHKGRYKDADTRQNLGYLETETVELYLQDEEDVDEVKLLRLGREVKAIAHGDVEAWTEWYPTEGVTIELVNGTNPEIYTELFVINNDIILDEKGKEIEATAEGREKLTIAKRLLAIIRLKLPK